MEPKGAHPFDPEGKHPLNPANYSGPMGECPICKGSGRQVARDSFGAHYEDCGACAGSGQIRDLSTKAKSS